ncbi:unnamed protein product [Pleuronectes platessa]|uniref:Uncharacterized protein n=1 Tax=Pleuronectes platessa TaxID=8262 RepID=A0A9N7Y024_PLEPL|nr:unnamed protein product [Pleuronectes platessa]
MWLVPVVPAAPVDLHSLLCYLRLNVISQHEAGRQHQGIWRSPSSASLLALAHSAAMLPSELNLKQKEVTVPPPSPSVHAATEPDRRAAAPPIVSRSPASPKPISSHLGRSANSVHPIKPLGIVPECLNVTDDKQTHDA